MRRLLEFVVRRSSKPGTCCTRREAAHQKCVCELVPHRSGVALSLRLPCRCYCGALFGKLSVGLRRPCLLWRCQACGCWASTHIRYTIIVSRACVSGLNVGGRNAATDAHSHSVPHALAPCTAPCNPRGRHTRVSSALRCAPERRLRLWRTRARFC